MQKIIFENTDKSIVIFTPTTEGTAAGLSVLAPRITPAGLPFWIVEDTVIPTDTTDRDKWELDGTEDEPDGYGA